MELIFEKSKQGRRGVTIPKNDTPVEASLDKKYLRGQDARFPSVSEPENSPTFYKSFKNEFFYRCKFLSAWFVYYEI